MNIITKAKGWVIADDGIQWMLCREYEVKGKPSYTPLAFIRSGKSVLLRCCREFGVPRTIVVALTRDLPESREDYDKRARPVPAAFIEPPTPLLPLPVPPDGKTAVRTRKPPRRNRK